MPVFNFILYQFEKPGRRENFDYPDMAQEAVTKALNDANVSYDKVQQAVVGYVFGKCQCFKTSLIVIKLYAIATGDSTCGQRALYTCGLTGIPIFNVNNNCSTGSSALLLANQLISGGTADCVLALGFEKMQRGSLGSTVRIIGRQKSKQ